MTIEPAHSHRCTVYEGHGARGLTDLDPDADASPLRDLLGCDVVCAHRQLDLASLIGLLVGQHATCIPIVDDDRHPIGAITAAEVGTYLDERPSPEDYRSCIAADLMTPMALVLDEHARIADAAELMSTLGSSYVVVVATDGALAGVVFAEQIVAWMIRRDQDGALTTANYGISTGS